MTTINFFLSKRHTTKICNLKINFNLAASQNKTFQCQYCTHTKMAGSSQSLVPRLSNRLWMKPSTLLNIRGKKIRWWDVKLLYYFRQQTYVTAGIFLSFVDAKNIAYKNESATWFWDVKNAIKALLQMKQPTWMWWNNYKSTHFFTLKSTTDDFTSSWGTCNMTWNLTFIGSFLAPKFSLPTCPDHMLFSLLLFKLYMESTRQLLHRLRIHTQAEAHPSRTLES